MQLNWTVYGLLGECGCIFYVGFTKDIRRRMREHAGRYGNKIPYVVLESGDDAECGLLAELKWIDALKENGALLTNRVVRANGGARTHVESTRARLSRASKGRTLSEEHVRKVAAALKGKPHDWSEEGLAACRRTQFKPGVSALAKLSDEKKASRAAKLSAQWDDIPIEDRSRMATERNKAAWAKRTPEQIAALKKAISEAQKRRFASGGKKPTMTAELRAENGIKISATKKVAFALLSPTERANYAARLNNISPEKKSEAMKRAWITRRSLKRMKG